MMWNCPVCRNEYDTPFCPRCGYDRSADLERFPTLMPPRGNGFSAAGRRLVRCDSCGGMAFGLERGSGRLRCLVCGQVRQAAGKTITAISAGDRHTVVLYSDGTVGAVGKNNCGQCNTGSWRDIVAIRAGFENTIGLRADGTLVATGSNYAGKSMVHTLTGVRELCEHQSNHTLFLRHDGSVATLGSNANGECNVGEWRDVIAADSGHVFSLGLRSDGTVLATGSDEYGNMAAGSWTEIQAISVGSWHSLGLRRDGTAVACGYETSDACKVGDWRELELVAAGGYFSAGLRRDGQICIASDRTVYRLAESWTDIVALAAGLTHLVGLRSDGTVVAVGSNEEGQCDVDRLMMPQMC